MSNPSLEPCALTAGRTGTGRSQHLGFPALTSSLPPSFQSDSSHSWWIAVKAPAGPVGRGWGSSTQPSPISVLWEQPLPVSGQGLCPHSQHLLCAWVRSMYEASLKQEPSLETLLVTDEPGRLQGGFWFNKLTENGLVLSSPQV